MDKHEIPEERSNVNKVFDMMNQKITVLLPAYGLNKQDRDDVVCELMGYNEEIRKQFLKEWHMVEAQDKVIDKLKYYLEVFGHDGDVIMDKIMGEDEITELLKKTR